MLYPYLIKFKLMGLANQMAFPVAGLLFALLVAVFSLTFLPADSVLSRIFVSRLGPVSAVALGLAATLFLHAAASGIPAREPGVCVQAADINRGSLKWAFHESSVTVVLLVDDGEYLTYSEGLGLERLSFNEIDRNREVSCLPRPRLPASDFSKLKPDTQTAVSQIIDIK